MQVELTVNLLPVATPVYLGDNDSLSGLLQHQVETWQALREHDLVFNTWDTGMGKTVAALLYLQDLAREYEETGRRKDVLFVAPVNELLAQHARAIRDFVTARKLPFNVLEVTAERLRHLEAGAGPGRAGEKLHELLADPRQFAGQSGIGDMLIDADTSRPGIVVVNPDIFYYALYYQYNAFDRRNLFLDFVSRFAYIVIDEFHYYAPKQFANFLFFLLLCEDLGHFAAGRKACLLSATPAPYMRDFLARLKIHIGEVRPPEVEAEPGTPGAAPVLAPAVLHLVGGDVAEQAQWLRERIWPLLEQGQDGAVIASSLHRLNRARQAVPWPDAGRITGPESSDNRHEAAARQLIWATPTVDIGFNFAKKQKDRQGLDFLVFEAFNHDEFWQRLGRAGRVLGKARCDFPSHIWALVPEDVVVTWRDRVGEGGTYARSALKQLSAELAAPPPRRDLVHYLGSEAFYLETFWPIYQLHGMTALEDRPYIQSVFDRVKEVFAGASWRSFGSMIGAMRGYAHQEEVFRRAEAALTTRDAQDFLFWWSGKSAGPAEGAECLRHPMYRRQVLDFVRGQYAAKKAIFSFRECLEGPVAAVYDPKGIFTDTAGAVYSLLHLLRYYDLRFFSGAGEFHRCAGETSPPADFYVEVVKFREEPLQLYYRYECPQEVTRSFFMEKYATRPVALRGLGIRGRSARGGAVHPLPAEVSRFLQDQYVVALVVPDAAVGALLSACRGAGIAPVKVGVTFPDAGKEVEYWAVVGTAAYLLYPEIRPAIFRALRADADKELPVII